VLAAVRARIGPDVPVAASLDLHGNITPLMLEHADGLFGTWYYPHTDSYERGAEAIAFLERVLKRAIAPVMHLEQLPVMIPTCSTDLEPGKRLNALCRAWEQRPGMIDCTIFHGFPYTDVPAVGMSVLTITDNAPELAAAAGKAVAQAIWEAREEYRPEILTPAEAIARALALPEGPVVINDTSDNPGGGSPGDSTHLLRAMLGMNLENACYAYIFDADTARQAHEAGVGAMIDVRLGGKTDTLHGAPIETEVYMKCLTDGRFRLTPPMGRGMLVDLGPMARLQIGGMDVLVGSRRNQVLDDEMFLLHGIDMRRYRIVAVKSSAHFRAGFTHLATAIIAADAPGATTLDLSGFPYQRIRRTIWPLDPFPRGVSRAVRAISASAGRSGRSMPTKCAAGTSAISDSGSAGFPACPRNPCAIRQSPRTCSRRPFVRPGTDEAGDRGHRAQNGAPRLVQLQSRFRLTPLPVRLYTAVTPEGE